MTQNHTGQIYSNDLPVCSVNVESIDQIDGKITVETAPFNGDQLYHAMTQKRPITVQIGTKRKEFFVSGFTLRPPYTILHVSE